MSWPAIVLLVYCSCIVLASLAGGWLPNLLRLTHDRMQLIMSFVAGLMLGVGLLHMLPHAIAFTGSAHQAGLGVLAGLLLMFFLIRAFDFHQHAPAEADGQPAAGKPAHSHAHPAESRHELSWVGVALGLSLHTAIDGMALAAAVQAEQMENTPVPLFGLATFLAILLHKPLDALSITSLMAAGGWTARTRQMVNAGFATMCPLGAGLVVFVFGQFPLHMNTLVGWALALAAGCFLCISLGDLLPELHFHAHDRVKLSVALLLGVALAYGIGQIEESYVNSHDHRHGLHDHLHPH